jgi:ketosteroid isomerase-like protein
MAVPSPNCDTVLRAIDAYNRGDVDALTDLMAHDVELRPPVSALRGIAYRGHQGVRQWFADLDESFSRVRIEPIELTDLGGLVLALTSFEAKGGESELEFDSELGLLLEVDEGLIVSWRGHFNHAAARAEAEAQAATRDRAGPPQA